MKNLDRYKKGAVGVIAVFFVLLFVYTGVSKLLDIGIFQSQMAQSEMLRPYTKLLASAVPVVELGLAGLLLGKSTRQWGLLGSFILMLGFSFYVYLIMNYNPSLPCSCGGILQAMDWPTHLYFNLTATVLAGLAWYVESEKLRSFWWPLSGGIGVVSLIVILFLTRPKPQVLQDDSFVRNYQEIGLEEIAIQPLSYNSYYIAGIQDSLVYLGNSTGFTHGLQWNYHTRDTTHFRLQLPDAPERFDALPKWQIKGNHFYIGEGVTPSLYRGRVGEWIAEGFMPTVPYYSDIVVIDTTHFIIKALQASTQKYVLADYRAEEPYVQIHDVLEQGFGNLFQADGRLIQDSKTWDFIYLYYYRNYLTRWDCNFMNEQNLPLLYLLDHSILQTHQGRKGTYLRENPISGLHSKIRVYGEYYWVQSQVMGAEESSKEFSENSIIDLYDKKGRTYKESIRLPHQNNESIRDFYITDHHIIALYPTQLVVYRYNNLTMAMDEQEQPNT